MSFSFFANSCSFRSIIATGRNIIPKTKDHKLKTLNSLWSISSEKSSARGGDFSEESRGEDLML